MTIRHPTRHRGTILIMAWGILLILTAMVLSFAYSMRVEAMASANAVAGAEADSAELAAEQYAISLIARQTTQEVFGLTIDSFRKIPVGNNDHVSGYFWMIRPVYDDPSIYPEFGLIDEASKLNLNTVDTDTFAKLPGMTPDLEDAVRAWSGKDPSGDTSSYSLLPTPYQAKQDKFETPEELLLVDGFTPDLVYGDFMGRTHRWLPYTEAYGSSSGIGSTPDTVGDVAPRGLMDFVTAHSAVAQAAAPGRGGTVATAAVAPVNVNTAPHEVLACLPGMDDSSADLIVSSRPADNTTGDASWASSLVPPEAASYITGTTTVYSADIVAVSHDGKAFRHCRVIINASTPQSPRIVYRRDLTAWGWPMEMTLKDALATDDGTPGGI